MIDWLKKRLSPVKDATYRWTQFAGAVEAFWEELFDPNVSALDRLKSIYTADPDDQQAKILDMGDYYEDELPVESVPISLAWRKYELFQKEATIPLENTFKRLGIPAQWAPLYGRARRVLRLDGSWKVGDAGKKIEFIPLHERYGADLFIRDHAPILTLDGTWTLDDTPPKKLMRGCFLTSRGVVVVDMDAATEEDLEKLDLVRARVKKVKPLHIVCDGIRFLLTDSIDVDDIPGLQQLKLDGTWKLGDPGKYIWDCPEDAAELIAVLDEAQMCFGGTNKLDGSWKLGDPGKKIYAVTVATAQGVIEDGYAPEFVTDLEWYELVNATTVKVYGILPNNYMVDRIISTAGLIIKGQVVHLMGFLEHAKAADESYSFEIEITY